MLPVEMQENSKKKNGFKVKMIFKKSKLGSFAIGIMSFMLFLLTNPSVSEASRNQECRSFYSFINNNTRAVNLRESVVITPDGRRIINKAENPSLDLSNNLPADIKKFFDELNSLSAVELAKRKESLTSAFTKLKAGSFNKKDEDGKYVPFNVTVNPIPLPIPKSYHDKLVESTRSLFESKTRILQLLYSKKNVTIDDLRKLAVIDTPDAVLKDFLNYLNDNYYFESGIQDPSLSDYRFISVVGIDHALTSLRQFRALGFEFNGGTPSGMSNTRAMIEIYKEVFPDYKTLFDSLLEADKTFQNLKYAMDQHGRFRTGRSDGISVVVSPGQINGAHPDIVTISEYSGMPLVRMDDLYIDRNGQLRLNQYGVDPKIHPVVTAIYNRQEESVLYAAAKSSRDLAFKVSTMLSEKETSNLEKKGFHLEKGVAYDFIKDDDGVVVDVRTDSTGKPLKTILDSGRLGKDPTRADSDQGNLDIIDLLHQKKIYISNIGGRTLDIKPLFAIIAKYFAPKYSKAEAIFSPPNTLLLNDPKIAEQEYLKFFNNPDNWVVKDSGGSGGDGIDILKQKNGLERIRVIEKVRKEKERVDHLYNSGNESAVVDLTIQEYVNSAVVTTAIGKGHEAQKGTIIPDLRLFTFMLPNYEVMDGNTMAYLGRNGHHGSAIANTSKGGEYFTVLVYDDNPDQKKNKKIKNTFEQPMDINAIKFMTVSDKQALDYFFHDMAELRHVLNIFSDNAPATKRFLFSPSNGYPTRLEQFVANYRSVMHLLGPKYRPFQSLFDGIRTGTVAGYEFRKTVMSMIESLQSAGSSYQGMDQLIKYWFNDWTYYDPKHLTHSL